VPEVAVVLPLKCLTLLHVATIDDTEGNSAPEVKITIELAPIVDVAEDVPSDSLTLWLSPTNELLDDIVPPEFLVLAPTQDVDEVEDILADALTTVTPTVTIDESPITIAPDSLTL
jgi:hypothetical protein